MLLFGKYGHHLLQTKDRIKEWNLANIVNFSLKMKEGSEATF